MQPPISLRELESSLNRTLKLAVDEGDAPSFEAAEQLFASYRLRILAGENLSSSPTRQAILLTAVNTAARCFLGGVEVDGPCDASLLVPCRRCRTLGEAVRELGGSPVTEFSADTGPLLLIGDCRDETGEGVLRLSFDGWCAAVTPPGEEPLPEHREWTLAGVLAGALGISETFQFVRGKNIQAADRPVVISLWKPETDGRSPDAGGPDVPYLPASAWIIGLGHLGQAYLWTLSMLPYARPEDVHLVLQDTDTLQRSNLSTSVLTVSADIDKLKTRAMATWCEERGFSARICERLFAENMRIAPGEPKVALCGVDNPQGRACLEDVGFGSVIEAGLGSAGEDYLNLRLHGFPSGKGGRSARAIWGGHTTAQTDPNTYLAGPAYQDLRERGLDICGLTTLAGRAVGASFVGTVAAAFCVAELVRQTMNEHRYAMLELNLRNPRNIHARLLPPMTADAGPYTLAAA